RDAGLVTGFYHFLWPGNLTDQAPVPPGAALPTRTRQASLAPELRAGPPEDSPLGAADPEEMRALFAAFQRGLHDGRNGLPAPGGTGTPTDAQADEGTDTDDVR
ncbi:hypothetical protein ABZ898_29405, partial [Streptomyces sp. NPDC046860]